MTKVRQAIWNNLKNRVYVPGNRIRGRRRRGGELLVNFTETIFQGLFDCKDAIADHCGIPQEQRDLLRHFRSDKPNNISEYMIDFALTTYPKERRWDSECAPLPGNLCYEVLLAAESEEGDEGNVDINTIKALEDFIKLVDIKSRIKVLVYRSPLNHIEDGFASVKAGMIRLLQRHARFAQDDAQWLLVGIPWYHQYPGLNCMNGQVDILEYSEEKKGPIIRKPEWPL